MTTIIKKICHECNTPLTTNPYAGSVPGEICRECHDKRYNSHICNICGKTEIITKPHTLLFIKTPDGNDHVVCGECISNGVNLLNQEVINE